MFDAFKTFASRITLEGFLAGWIAAWLLLWLSDLIGWGLLGG